MQIEGYFVEVGIPIRSGVGGGRSEADVLGFKVKNEEIEIFHIEVGSLCGNPLQNAKMIEDNFSKLRVDAITEYCRNKLSVSQNQKIDYRKLYIAVYASDKTMRYWGEICLYRDCPHLLITR